MTHRLSRWPASTSGTTAVDTDLEHRLISFIYQQHVPNGERVEFTSQGGVVTVRGKLPTAHAKWMCIECCRRVAGVLRIDDQLSVGPTIVQQPSVGDEPVVRLINVDRIHKAYVCGDGMPSHSAMDVLESAHRVVVTERIARRKAAA